MRSFCLLCALLLLGCGKPNQALTAPCLGEPATASGGLCPPCNADSDCRVLSNMCDPQSYCVHKDSSFVPGPTGRTCSEPWPPTRMSCVCLANVCDWRW
jgi:hypothetical protein